MRGEKCRDGEGKGVRGVRCPHVRDLGVVVRGPEVPCEDVEGGGCVALEDPVEEEETGGGVAGEVEETPCVRPLRRYSHGAFPDEGNWGKATHNNYIKKVVLTQE